MAIFSGIMSGMAFGPGAGGDIEKAAVTMSTPETWKASGAGRGAPGRIHRQFPVVPILELQERHRQRFANREAPLLGNMVLPERPELSGARNSPCSKWPTPRSADLAFAGWTVLMSSMIVFSSILGIVLGEWRGSSREPRVYWERVSRSSWPRWSLSATATT